MHLARDSMAVQQCPCPTPRKESVLSLDGGGIRGYAVLLILHRLMMMCKELEHEYDRTFLGSSRDGEDLDDDLPLPCHYFDYMIGTSTGGIIAIMLGRLRMSIEDCMVVYRDFGHHVFGKKRTLWRLRTNKYKTKRVEEFMQTRLKTHCKDKDRRTVEARERQPLLHDPTVFGKEEENREKRQHHRYVPCRVAVLAYRKADNEGLYMFRSYHNDTAPDIKHMGKLLNLSNQEPFEMWKTARATSAAPTYFSPMTIDNTDFVDGGLDANNPSDWAWREVESMHRNNPGGKCVGAHGGIRNFVSMGTGKKAPVQVNVRGRVRRLIDLVKKGLSKMTDPEKTHESMVDWLPEELYFRLNVEEGLEKVKLDDFEVVGGHDKTLHDIKASVDQYLAQKSVSTMMRRLARRLVDHRRSRIRPGPGQAYRGLSEPGPLRDDLVQRFRWDEPAASPSPSGNGSSSRSSPLTGHEMPASPVGHVALQHPQSPQEAPSSPLNLNTDVVAPRSPQEVHASPVQPH